MNISGDFTIFVITRDHQNFICDNLASILREVGESSNVLLIDTGSRDETYSVAKRFLKENEMRHEIFQLPRGTTSLQALEFATHHCDSKYLIGISGDDAFGSDYKAGMREYHSLNETGHHVGFFDKIICNSKLSPISKVKSSWADNSSKNRRLLEYSNPGNSAGVILPWQYLKEIGIFTNSPEILVEDYWLWLALVDKCLFHNISIGSVLYRKHSSNLTLESNNRDYIFSLGFCSGYALNRKHRLLGPLRNLLLILRLSRHVSIMQIRFFLKGWICGKNYI